MPPSSSTTVENTPPCQRILRTTQALHINETRSAIQNLSCGKVVDRPYCICESRLFSNLRFQHEHLLLKLCDNLLHRHQHCRIVKLPNSWISCTTSHKCSSCISPAQTRQTNVFQQTSESPSPVHQAFPQLSSPRPNCSPTNNDLKLCATRALRHQAIV